MEWYNAIILFLSVMCVVLICMVLWLAHLIEITYENLKKANIELFYKKKE